MQESAYPPLPPTPTSLVSTLDKVHPSVMVPTAPFVSWISYALLPYMISVAVGTISADNDVNMV